MRKRILVASFSLMLLSGCAARVAAQASPAGHAGGTPEKGFSARLAFEGSSSSQGQVLDLNSSTGYTFNKYFSVGLGIPVYFVRASTPAPGSGEGPRSSSSGDLGDVYGALNLTLDNPVLAYSSSLSVTAPTGDSAKGRSTGRMTYDWDNRFEHEFFEWVTPYVAAGLANSVSTTRLFKRPFLTYGHLAHLEAGMDVKLRKSLTFTVSAYEVLPWGEQHVFSRFIRRGSSGTGPASHRRFFEINPETIGTADLTRDNGYSAGLSFSPTRVLDFSVSLTRSVPLQLNTVSFGIGLNISRLFQGPRARVASQPPAGETRSAQR